MRSKHSYFFFLIIIMSGSEHAHIFPVMLNIICQNMQGRMLQEHPGGFGGFVGSSAQAALTLAKTTITKDLNCGVAHAKGL